MTTAFSPGDLVRARGREWVNLPSPHAGWLSLRPLSGSEADVQLIHPDLELDPVQPARFELPAEAGIAVQAGAQLLGEALRLSLRRGAGPFRSAAHLGFEPRAYQLVPLLMALRLPTVRLLVADDVGIGKTIEAGMVLRELIDRGEVDRFAVLCPPHLVEQWTDELRSKFDLDAVAVTAASAGRLERGLPVAETLFDAFPHTVVSLDYIKAEKRRDAFARACPSFVIVDEAHACVGTHQGRQQRFALLQRLAADADRHMLMLTATPHSGDEHAFARLLSLLDPSFAELGFEDQRYRQRLAQHFVQRRRIDITSKDWGEERTFPKHETTEIPYPLGADHTAFHEAVLDYCLDVVDKAGTGQRERRLAFWGTLALMRCVGSSPAAALSALRNRLGDADRLETQVFDDDGDDEDAVDVEPAAAVVEDARLRALVDRAAELTQRPDPKARAVVDVLKPLVAGDANPVVFCRFIATAEHVGAALRKAFPKLTIEVVTGALTPDERRARVAAMAEADQRILVATDCLSEGINLQALFDAAIQYDLSWNPTRHQQREGRVDRFGQPRKTVRSVLMFSPDSAIDGAVLDVILRKARAMREATGVTVPLPDERGPVTEALMAAMILRRGTHRQLSLDLRLEDGTRAVEARWRDAAENETKSRARFAQHAMHPEEVAPEWQRTRALLGGPAEVQRFIEHALARFDAPLEPRRQCFAAHVGHLPPALRDRLATRGLEGTVRLVFDDPAPQGAFVATRSHPLTATLAETLVEGALDPEASPGATLGRTGAWPTAAVTTRTLVLMLRLRFKLTVHARRERMLLAEEAGFLAFGPGDAPIAADVAQALLAAPAAEDLAAKARDRLIDQARARLPALLDGPVAAHARERAAALAEDHARLRATGAGASRVTVEPALPADVIGLFVLLPAEI
jgi:superfamily II DNA or RNA helicase